MNSLPLHLLDDILFRLEPKSLAMMQCTNRSIKSHISDDPDFESEYFSRFGSSLFKIFNFGPNIYSHHLVFSCDSMSQDEIKCIPSSKPFYIFGSCSGLILVYIGGLFIVNPLTKKVSTFGSLWSKLIPTIVGGFFETPYNHKTMCIGFTVDRNRTTKRFKIVCILEMQTRYKFEISDGDSWRLSKTTITAGSKSDFAKQSKLVYLDGTLHWLRKDGSIIAFNPETEQERFIPSTFHREPDMRLLFAADDKTNRLTLISGEKNIISVYTLSGYPKWTLVRRIKNISMEESKVASWNMVAYDGKRLVVGEKKKGSLDSVVHAYDMEANNWRVLWTKGSVSTINLYKFTPFLFSVGECENNCKEIVASNDQRILDLTAIMRIINTIK